ncbi:MAG: glycosyltransferase family 4 protein [Candidatus Glassbacteria bacterium]|nr:glycosyltransferase family 4 protein [Candidatus Glassbacteria bacterium]
MEKRRTYKILRIIARLNIGGPALHCIILNSELDKRKYISQLVTGVESPYEGNMYGLAQRKSVLPVVIDALGREIFFKEDFRALIKLVRLINLERPDIVHTHTAKAGTLGRIAAKLTGVPIIIHTFHGHVFHSYFGFFRTRFFLWLERVLAKFTDVIITVSEQQRDEIIKYRIAEPDKIIAIPLGLDLKPFIDSKADPNELRREFSIPEQTKLVGIVARLVPIKNHVCFLEAARLVLDHCSDVCFMIIGDGELRGALEQKARELGLQDRVIFMGFQHNLEKIYAGLDIVALSSYNEGLPVALIEAMAAGKPVISTEVGGVVDLILDGYNGLLVPSNQPGDLAEAVLYLLEHPERRKMMGEAGRNKVYPHFDKKRLVEDIDALYENLLVGGLQNKKQKPQLIGSLDSGSG